MTDPTVITNSVGQAIETVTVVKTQLSPYLPALAVAAGWAGREIRNFNTWLFNVATFAISHGGFAKLLLKAIWNNDPQK